MNRKHWLMALAGCALAMALTLSAAGAAGPPTWARDQATVLDSSETAAAAAVVLNEIMPRPVAGQFQWIELRQPSVREYRLYLPIMMKNAGGAFATTGFLPLAPSSPAADPDISGWQVSNQSGGNYTIPAALPPVPGGAFVLIRFDGLGPAADDYNFADGVAVLHSPAGMVNIFNQAADQVALYTGATHNAQTIRDFAAYGAAPGAAANDAIAAGLWHADWWLGLVVGSGAQAEGETLVPNRAVGLLPGHANLSPDDWAVYDSQDLTPGAANPVPRATWSTVADGTTMASDGFALGWPFVEGATYLLQIDNDQTFASPWLNTTLTQPYYHPTTPPPAGAHWWRVRTILGTGQQSAWSTPVRVNVVAVAGLHAAGDDVDALAIGPQVELAMTWLRQRKDSRLLCLDGDNEGNPASAANEVAWDAVHPDGIYTHGQNNCVRASIAMIVTHYGGNLSQDRLSYQLFENWGSPIQNIGEVGNPLLDLGHDRTTLVCGGSGSKGGELFAWALGINVADYTYAYAKPTFAQVQGWIDDSRPVMRFHSGHQTVIGGYRTLAGGTQQIRLFDPWSGTTWENYSTLGITCYYVPPASAPGVRSDEAGIWTDADGDGIMDWDEQNRFHTQPVSADSDEDWVQDKQDMREYVFTTAGNYNLRAADFDGDGQRKELDANNDGDGAVDGCEDFNYNGKYEAALGETDNFNAASQRACTPIFDILQPTQANPVNAGAFNGPDKILVQVKTATPPSSPVTYAPGDFTVRVGGQASTVLAVYRVLDTHFLIVSPHTQAAADYYDLEVTLLGQTDTETRAVFYLPKLRADQVLVIDRSGSMADYGKLDAAKNAARAFIDHTNVDDMIGVVSFESGTAVNYALTTVTGDPQWNAAKAAVNALALGGATALGPGALAGYNEIIARGQADHDWSMALMSDGMENVTPYWGDATVSGVIVPSRVVVHTVALGRDADTTLLSAIAGAMGGTPYEAGVDILPLSSAESAPAAMPGPNLSTTLPNRLADIYKAIGEEIGHQQRIFEKTGRFCERLTFEVPVEDGLPEAIFTVNWDDEKTPITMILIDPDGKQVKHAPPGVREIQDKTHHQFRVRSPKRGVWVVDLRTNCANYLFILSGWSPTTMHLGFGLPPARRVIGAEIPILVVLADNKPIKGAEVRALIQGPNADIAQTLQLFDDGHHADGRGGDGVYGNLFTKALMSGQYMVKATGWGVNNASESFIRHRHGSFTVLPRVAYIWLHDLPTANAYRTLLLAHGINVEFIHMDDVAKTAWNRYALIVVGPETGDGPNWGTTAAVGALRQYSTPILGLGEGGYALFGKLDLNIGYANGWHGDEKATYAVDAAHPVWHSPYHVPLPRERVVDVYTKTTNVGILVVRQPANVTLIGREPRDQTHYNLLQQTARFLLWGWDAGPSAMTSDGRHLFINVARYLGGI